MKNSMLLIIMMIMTTAAFTQQNDPSPTLTKQDYLQKSKNQKIVFYVFAGMGTGLIITGITLNASHSGPYIEYYTGGFLAAGGLAALAISVPFFIASMKNKHRAMSLSFKTDKIQKLNKTSFVYKLVPSLSLAIHL